MSGLKHKMTNYEVVPPAEVWDKIASSLDESELDKAFPAKLHDMQVNPPAAAWINIEAALTGAEAPVIPLKKKTSSFIRYAAAAVIIGLIATAVFKYAGRTSGSSETDNTNIVKAKPAEAGIVPSLPVEKNNPATSTTDEVIPENKSVIALAEQPAPIREQRGIHRAAAVKNYPYADASDYAGNPLYAYADYTMPNLADRYIMLMTPEGNIIRMSKKLGNLVCCVSGEEQDADCKSQIKKWQEKLAASPAAPGNFLDIVNLVNSLDENGTEL
jgi:hypothetical protein